MGKQCNVMKMRCDMDCIEQTIFHSILLCHFSEGLTQNQDVGVEYVFTPITTYKMTLIEIS